MPYVLECLMSWNAVRLGGPGVPLAPNTTRQALEIAGAKNERRLFPVACMRLLGQALAEAPPKGFAPRVGPGKTDFDPCLGFQDFFPCPLPVRCRKG